MTNDQTNCEFFDYFLSFFVFVIGYCNFEFVWNTWNLVIGY